jgi:pimeloyl-ACP methyl ester carboxylesterase
VEPRLVTVERPGPRTLRVAEAGDRTGRAVVVHHGTPGNRELYAPWVAHAQAAGLRLVAYDRPGYGDSSPHRGRRVADAAADVAAIADALGIDRFATWGVSGGGPHALACAALLPDRVVAAASLAGVAPFDAESLNYFAGMGRDNIVEFGAAMQGREAIEPLALAQAEAIRAATPGEITASMRTLVSPVDDAVLDDEVASFLARSMGGALAPGVDGWLDDDLAFLEPFGFDVAQIAVPVLVWHGRHDRFVPVTHGEWLARRIPGADVRISADDGHLTLSANRVPEVQAWLQARF